jgi:FAD synthetase
MVGAMGTAGIVVVGNEVLSGKVQEENASLLVRELRAVGVGVRRIVVIRDELDEIEAEVRLASERYEHVFTSGGIGSTHDDVTVEGVARALRLPLVRDAELEDRIVRHFGARATPSVLRMADVPEGSELLGRDVLLHPLLKVRNVFVLPGVPLYFRRKLEFLKPLVAASPIVLRQLFVRVGEEVVGDIMRAALVAEPSVEIGSYPRFDDADHRVRITVESRDAAAVERALAYLVAHVAPADVVRVE